MATLIHESPLGDLEIPTVLGAVPVGVPFDVDDDIALSLLTQGDLFRLAAPAKIAELRKLATDADIDPTGLTARQLVTELAIAAVDALLAPADPEPPAAPASPTGDATSTTTKEVSA